MFNKYTFKNGATSSFIDIYTPSSGDNEGVKVWNCTRIKLGQPADKHYTSIRLTSFKKLSDSKELEVVDNTGIGGILTKKEAQLIVDELQALINLMPEGV